MPMENAHDGEPDPMDDTTALQISYIADHFMELPPEERQKTDPVAYARSQGMEVTPDMEKLVRSAIMAAIALKDFGRSDADKD